MTRPSSPCKRFNKKNSLACYMLEFNQKHLLFDHYELYRIINPKAGEYYVVPKVALQKKAHLHLSYHKSGVFHWREESGARVMPRDGEADHRRASLLTQAMEYLSHHLDGYCLALGPKVSKEALKTMLEILDGYILPSLNFIIYINFLLDRKNLMIPLLETPHRRKADKLVAEAINNRKFSIISSAKIESEMRKEFGDQCKIAMLEPKSEKYMTFSGELMMKLVNIARDLSLQKMKDKPHAFWTRTPITCFE